MRLIAALLAAPALIYGIPVDDAVMRHKQLAIDRVRSTCARDVEHLCSVRRGPALQMDGALMLHPFRISAILDDMMNSAAASNSKSNMEDTKGLMSVSFFTSSPDLVFDGMLFELISHLDGASGLSTDQVFQQMSQHGQEILSQKDGPETRRRLARRLTEVSPDQIREKAKAQPFRCQYQNACLYAAFEQGIVSTECSHAMRSLDEVPQLTQQTQAFETKYSRVMLPLLWMYAALCLLTLGVAHYRRSQMNGKRLLKRRILQAIYSNPQLKADVEEELGEPLGAVPPLPWHALNRAHQFRFCFLLKVALLSTLVVLVFVAPYVVLPLCFSILMVRFCYLLCSPPRDPECVCCCCGGSTTDYANGTVSEKQACCTCCKGTGVCAVGCASCCAPDGHGCCCCSCSGGCCGCCGSKGSCGDCCKNACTCCCCGGSAEAAKNGTLSDEQACCTCCKGTGVCAASCMNCCGGGKGGCGCCTNGCDCCSKKNIKVVGRGQKHLFACKEPAVYYGIPIQVV